MLDRCLASVLCQAMILETNCSGKTKKTKKIKKPKHRKKKAESCWHWKAPTLTSQVHFAAGFETVKLKAKTLHVCTRHIKIETTIVAWWSQAAVPAEAGFGKGRSWGIWSDEFPKAAGSALPPDPAILFAGAKPAQNAESLPQALCSWSICATNRGES